MRELSAGQNTDPVVAYTMRAVLAVNRVLDECLAGAYKPLRASLERTTAEGWYAAGLPIERVVASLQDATVALCTTGRHRQPWSLSYFDARIRDTVHPTTTAAPALEPDIELVMAYARRVTKLDQLVTPGRVQLIRQRIAEANGDPSECLFALDGLQRSEWHQKTGNLTVEDALGSRRAIERLSGLMGYRLGKRHRVLDEPRG